MRSNGWDNTIEHHLGIRADDDTRDDLRTRLQVELLELSLRDQQDGSGTLITSSQRETLRSSKRYLTIRDLRSIGSGDLAVLLEGSRELGHALIVDRDADTFK